MSVATAVPTGTWTADKVHSSIGFEVEHMVSTFRGRFEDYDVRIADGRLEGAVRVASVRVYDENLEAHLQSPDFFDAELHPELRFESRDLTIDDEGGVTLEGDLTIKGVTKPVTGRGRYVHVEADMGGGERIGLALEATVDRREFALNWNAPLPKGGFVLGNDVTLVVALELVRAAE
ncbi:MAG TPA: YceI family protein [Thermoleophilaceae bacterium]|nr:YceI family protein [Thermoleophilaceae bacterium]